MNRTISRIVMLIGLSSPHIFAADFNSRADMHVIRGEHGTTVKTIAASISRLAPKQKSRATEIATLLMKFSPDPVLSVAIIMQESGFRDVHVMESGLDVTTHEYRSVYKDMGITQINAGTALDFRCDVDKLIQHDLVEAIKCHSRVLSAKLALCRGLGNDIVSRGSCYNSTSDAPRRAYEKHIRFWMNKLK